MARTPPKHSSPPEGTLRTSREVYDRLRWDPRFDPRRCTIGYEDRARGMLEIPLMEFTPDGDIPWHRVWHVRAGSEVLWDRRARIDRVFRDPIAQPSRTEWYDDTFFAPLPVWRFDARAGEWAASQPPPALTEAPRALRVLTWNVLSDLHDADKTLPARRHPRLIERLGELDLDVIALQEVTPGMLAALCRAPWVRASYALTDVPPGTSLAPQGQLVLSRVPMVRAGLHTFSKHKRVVVCELGLAGHRVVLAAVHLTSDHGRNGPASRAEQIAAIVAHLPDPERSAGQSLSSVMLGDFNAREAETFDAARSFSDAWTSLRPSDPGVTFDPTVNPLAALVSLSGRPARLDRMLLRAPDGVLVATQVEALGTAVDPRAGMFLSDHVGLVFTLRPEAAAQGVSTDDVALRAPVHTSALAWLPPPEQGAIDAIREAHDRHRDRWMPHVNLLYGFVPDDDFDAAAARVEQAVGDLAPFSVTLAHFDRFDHAGSHTVFLRPESHPPGALEALQARLQAAFSRCTEQSERGASGYTAHLTVAQFARGEAAVMRDRMRDWQADWKPLRFDVRELSLMSRRGDGPFVVRTRVALGGRRSTLTPCLRALGALDHPPSDAAREAALDLLRELAPDVGVGAVHAVGSHRMGLACEGSDLDAVLLGPADTSRNDYFQALCARIKAAGVLDAWRDVPDALAPVLSLTLAGVKIDLQHARFSAWDAPCDPSDLDPAALDRFEAPSRRALTAVLDADALMAHVGARADLGVFRVLARAVKRWARARAIDRNALGFPGGFAWTVLAAWSLCRAPTLSPDEALDGFFAALAAWRWPSPIALGDAADFSPHPARDRMPVLAPVGPHRNAARNVTRGTLAVVSSELARAVRLCERVRRGELGWGALFENALPEGPGLAWTLRAPDDDALARCLGWIDGQTLSLLLSLERDDVRPRPFSPLCEGAAARGFIGCAAPAGAPDPAALLRASEPLRAAFARWPDRPADATLHVSVARDGAALP